MTNLLDNPLVRKYFGCGDCGFHSIEADGHDPEACEAKAILRAMEAPIKVGERYLDILNYGHREANGLPPFAVKIADGALDRLHAYTLRLPDRFQCRCARQDICAVHPELARNVFKPAQKKECGCSSHPCPNCPGGHYGHCEKKPAPEPEKCRYNHGTGSVCDCKLEPKSCPPAAHPNMSSCPNCRQPDNTVYCIQFSAHGDSHEVNIDLECFAQALAPHLARKP